MPAVPNAHALGLLILTVVALYLFSKDRYRLEVTSLGILALLTAAFSVFPFPGIEPDTLFFGFGHEALIAVCALMVVGQGLVVTGALEPVGRVLARIWSRAPYLSFLLTLVVGGVLSAFVNNTPIVVLLLPILISVCLRAEQSATKILMPMGFATLVGGMATTIGTSTNLLVVSVARDMGIARFGMFDFALPAAIAAGVAIIYLWLIAPRLLPDRPLQLLNASPRLFDALITIDESSNANGRTVAESRELAGDGLSIVRIRRGDSLLYAGQQEVLRPGDRLRVRDTTENLTEYTQALGGRLDTIPIDPDDRDSTQTLAEVAVVHGSVLDRTNLKGARFLTQYGLQVVALHREGKDIWTPYEEIGDVILAQGDVMLVQGARAQIRRLKQNADFLVLDASRELPRTAKAPLALMILVSVVALAATDVMPIAVSATLGALIMLITRCLGLGAAIRAISPSVFFIVAASLALGSALVDTGATAYITDIFLFVTSGWEPIYILSALMLVLAVLTNVVSNNAAAVIGTPIAIGIANSLALPPEPFILAVLFGANMSYATPMAYKTNLLVMSAGQYRFSEFVKVGTPLTVLMWVTLTIVLSMIYFE